MNTHNVERVREPAEGGKESSDARFETGSAITASQEDTNRTADSAPAEPDEGSSPHREDAEAEPGPVKTTKEEESAPTAVPHEPAAPALDVSSGPAPSENEREKADASSDELRAAFSHAESAGARELSAPAKIVKRYSNRKLYDTARSKYVTLDEIARMVKAGDDVRIIDNESKEDLTSVTLTQIIYEQEKAARRMPLGMLRGIIQTGGETLNEFFVGSVVSAQKSVESSVTELRQSAQSIRDAASRQLSELTESARRFFSREERRAEEFKRAAWLSIDQLEARLVERVHQVRATRAAVEQHQAEAKEGEAPPSVDELLERNTHTLDHVESLRTRLAALSVLVDRLEQAARGTTPDEE